MQVTVSALLTNALAEIRVARAGDVISADMQDLALYQLNELFDHWNAQSRAIYNINFSTFTLTANHQPHTIGPSGADFTLSPNRPTAILGANLVLPGSAAVQVPLNLRDDSWWLQTRVKTLTAAVPTDLYYSPDWPNGSIYLWPIPNAAYQVYLELRNQLSATVAATDTLDLPQGYPQAIRLTLAELLAPSFGQQVSPSTASKARDARAAVFGLNDAIPNLVTRDAGMPSGGAFRGRFNYLTGEVQ